LLVSLLRAHGPAVLVAVAVAVAARRAGLHGLAVVCLAGAAVVVAYLAVFVAVGLTSDERRYLFARARRRLDAV
jgi:hypothetical protein